MANDNDFLIEIQDGFLEESTELLEQVEKSFLELEKNPSDVSILEKIFRLAHNIKGSAAAVGFDDLSKFAHSIENLLVKLKNKEIPATSDVIDVLLQSNDTLHEYVDALKSDKTSKVDTSKITSKIKEIIEQPPKKTEDIVKSDNEVKVTDSVVESMPSVEKQKPQSIGDILIEEKVATPAQVENAAMLQNSKIGTILVEQGVISEKQLDNALDKQEAMGKSQAKNDDYIRLPISKIEGLLNMFGEQVILQSTLEHYRENLTKHESEVGKTILSLNKITHDLQQTAISLRMLSLRNLFNKMQRTVRDTAKLLDKEVQFVTDGEDTELDKSIIDELASPLTHLIRNSVDHGIEMPSDREKNGKPKMGTVTMKASYKGRYFCLEIEDDGKGLDKDKIKEKAIKLGLIQKDKDLSHQDILNLIMSSGFSTKEVATNISGRGVGMDAIKVAIEKLRGTMSISSETGKGTKVTINLPPTLAIFNGMIVLIADKKYVVPNSEVMEIYSVSDSDMKNVGINEKIVKINDRVLPIIDSRKVLNISNVKNIQKSGHGKTILFSVQHKNKQFGVVVDDIIGQQRIVYKNLGKELENLAGVSGGTILGDGHVALILEMGDLIELHKRCV